MSKASSIDLRHYLETVRERGKGHFVQIDKTISGRFETTAVVRELARKLRNPVLYFSHLSGSDYPMVSNVCCSVERVARSVDIGVDELNQRLIQAQESSIPPVVLRPEDAPVYQESRAQGEFSLNDFPGLYYSENQELPYITSAIVIARDPDSGSHNQSFHRLMVAGDNTAAIYMTPNNDLDRIWKRNSASGHPTDLVAVIGTHPLWCYAALVAGALDHEDFDITGGVLGEPLALVKAEQSDILFPAYSEIALEGQISATATIEEGPFGEFLGFEALPDTRPLVSFTRMHNKTNPIFQDIVAGQSEHTTMSSVSLRARLQRDYFEDVEAVVDFWLPAAMTLFVSIDERCTGTFDAMQFMESMLRKETYLKQLICFDADVDLRKQAAVQSALANFVQPDQHILILSDCGGNGVDPSEVDGKTSKIAIDARQKTGMQLSKLPDEISESFDLSDWI